MELLSDQAERSRGILRVDREKLALPTGKQRCALASLAMSWLHLLQEPQFCIRGHQGRD